MMPVLCVAFPVSSSLLHIPWGRGAGDWNVKSPDRMLPDSLRSARHKLSLHSGSESNSARLSSAGCWVCCRCKPEIHPSTAYLPPGGFYVSLPLVSSPRPLFSRGSSILLLAMHPETLLCWCCPAFCVWAFVFTSLIKGRLSLIPISRVFSSYCFCFLK